MIRGRYYFIHTWSHRKTRTSHQSYTLHLGTYSETPPDTLFHKFPCSELVQPAGVHNSAWGDFSGLPKSDSAVLVND